jgi:hypothetical protein
LLVFNVCLFVEVFSNINVNGKTAAASSKKRGNVKFSKQSSSLDQADALFREISPGVPLIHAQRSPKSKSHSIFFFGPLVSKAEARYHDSQRKRKTKEVIAQSSYYAHE